MSQYRVAVVIPVFNQWNLTAACLRSLREHTPDEDIQVIVVDNGSTDETAGACGVLGRELFGERFEHVRLDENINFGPGCNLGASRADADFLFFLNNNTLLTPGWLPPLVASFENNLYMGAIGPLLLFPVTERVQHVGVAFRPEKEGTHLYEQFPGDHPLVHVKRSVQAITGAALLIPRALFVQVGAFFEGYRNGYEDFDLCFRLRRLGRELSCCTQSRVYHLSSRTAGRFSCEAANRNIFLSRFGNDVEHDFSHFATKDGYEIGQDPRERMIFKLRRERRDELVELVKNNQSARFLWDFVCQEPLFIEGYELLARVLEEQGEWSRACSVRFLRVHFAPSIGSCRKLLNAAQISKNSEIYKSAISALKVVQVDNEICYETI